MHEATGEGLRQRRRRPRGVREGAAGPQHDRAPREGNKAEILRDSNRLAIVGMTSLAVAMVGAVMLITDFVFDGDTMIASVVGVTIAFVLVW